jgi:hypothetical protein
VSAPPRVLSLLRSAPAGPVPVLHRGPDAVYVEIAGRCVGVVSRRATAVPCAVRTGSPVLPEVARVRVDAGVLHLDDEALVVGRVVDVRVPAVRTLATTAAPPPGDVPAMVGRGDGLTPYDDDVLCGWLAVHRATGVATDEVDAAVRACLDRTTLLSATLLECAMHGEVIPEFARWLAAIGSGREADLAARLAAVGHTSGRGLLEGARAALAHLVHLVPIGEGAA